ncbi:protein TIFY 10c-like [Typha angustifolia]|uniref:protein TIFY 10c-like n=1 Tax=Typha angustifolia TaxID=59011 RepID=UPI003C2F6378
MEKKAERAGEKTNFSVTCSLLSQYLKEKRGFGGLGLDMALEQQPKELYRPPTTMSLMPGVDASEEEEEVPSKEENIKDLSSTVAPEKAQLTIFYDGKVLVFDNFPGEKFKDMIEIASKQSKPMQNLGPAAVDGDGGCSSRQNPAMSTSGGQAALPRPLRANVSDMPIARRKSLLRFLEKRKDRVNSKAPYQVNGSSANKPEDSKSWLGLGRQDLQLNTSSESRR